MNITVTLEIPEHIYRDAEDLARSEHKTPSEKLAEWLSSGRKRTVNEQSDSGKAKLEQEIAAYKVKHPQLLKEHLDQWVAFHEGQLIDWDVEEDSLMTRIIENFPETAILVRRVEPEPEKEIYVPSFRLVA